MYTWTKTTILTTPGHGCDRCWSASKHVHHRLPTSAIKTDEWRCGKGGDRLCWFLLWACVVSLSEYIKFSDNQALPLNKAHKFYGSFAPKARKRSLCKLLFLVNTANFTRKRYTRLAKWNKKHNCVVITVLLTSLPTCGVIDELGWQ